MVHQCEAYLFAPFFPSYHDWTSRDLSRALVGERLLFFLFHTTALMPLLRPIVNNSLGMTTLPTYPMRTFTHRQRKISVLSATMNQGPRPRLHLLHLRITPGAAAALSFRRQLLLPPTHLRLITPGAPATNLLGWSHNPSCQTQRMYLWYHQ